MQPGRNPGVHPREEHRDFLIPVLGWQSQFPGNMTHLEIAKWPVAFVALYSFGGFVVVAIVPSTSRQHLWNPAWPPHAKFHNCQSMLMGIFTGSLSLYILFAADH